MYLGQRFAHGVRRRCGRVDPRCGGQKPILPGPPQTVQLRLWKGTQVCSRKALVASSVVIPIRGSSWGIRLCHVAQSGSMRPQPSGEFEGMRSMPNWPKARSIQKPHSTPSAQKADISLATIAGHFICYQHCLKISLTLQGRCDNGFHLMDEMVQFRKKFILNFNA